MPFDTQEPAPTSTFSIREQSDHMDEALADLATALLFATDPIVRGRIENARRHLVKFNEWPAEAERAVAQ